MDGNILASLVVIGLVAAAIGAGTYAYFSDVETVYDNQMQAGTLDLTVSKDGESFDDDPEYALVELDDLKPSQDHYVDKWIRVVDNPAKVYMHITAIQCNQGIQTEPEEKEENETGQWNIDDYVFYDLTVDQGEIISLEAGKYIGDFESCWIPLGETQPGVPMHIVQSFHMDADVTNWAQGDRCTFVEEFHALQTNAPTDQLNICDPWTLPV